MVLYMNINLFKKKNIVSVDTLTQTFVTQNEIKDLRIMMKQLYKKIEEKHEKIEKKNTTNILLKSLKEINYTFRAKETKQIESSLPVKDELSIVPQHTDHQLNNELSIVPQHIDHQLKDELSIVAHNQNYISDKELEEKSKAIIEDIHKYINDINQYNYTINGYLFQQLRDRIDEQDQLIRELYEHLEIKN